MTVLKHWLLCIGYTSGLFVHW